MWIETLLDLMGRACALVGLSALLANCSRWQYTWRSRIRASMKGPTDFSIWPFSSAHSTGFHNRLKPGAAIILIQTRWHEDDLAGRILPEDYDGRTGWVVGRDGERWYVVNLPALAGRRAAQRPVRARPGPGEVPSCLRGRAALYTACMLL